MKRNRTIALCATVIGLVTVATSVNSAAAVEGPQKGLL